MQVEGTRNRFWDVVIGSSQRTQARRVRRAELPTAGNIEPLQAAGREARTQEPPQAASETPRADTQPTRSGLIGLATPPAHYVLVQHEPLTNPPHKLTRGQYSQEMLTGDLTAEMLSQVADPVDLIQARLEAIRKPTPAVVVNMASGNEQPINPAHLATREQAEAMLRRLQELGLDVHEIEEIQYSSGPFRLEFRGDDRRMYMIAGMNVGLLLERYARYTKQEADRMTLEEWKRSHPS